MSFFPTDYQLDKSESGYFKFIKDDENKFRIMSAPIIGYEQWSADKKVKRFRKEQGKPVQLPGGQPVKEFWTFIVFSYRDEAVKILNITQKSIQKSILGYCEDADWGVPGNYDIKVKRSGDGMDTEYVCTAMPHKRCSQFMIDAFKEKPINLEALFDGGDPFACNAYSCTPTVIESINTSNQDAGSIKPQEASGGAIITHKQSMELVTLLNQCDPTYKDVFNEGLKGMGCDIATVPSNRFDSIRKKLEENVMEFNSRREEQLPF